jgi:acyl-CoA thioesterase
VSIETSISHVAPIKQGDVLIARARELNLTNRTGLYQVSVERGDGQILAWFKGTVYRTGREWEVS